MDSVVHYFSSSDEGEEISVRCKYRNLRDKSSVFELPEKRFIKLFRLSKTAFRYLLEEMDGEFKISSRTPSIPNVLKVAAALRFFAEGSYQQSVGHDHLIGMSQSTISVVLSEVLSIMERKICPKWVSFRQTELQRQECCRAFYEKHAFPGIIGCIDGTHIRIVKPATNEHIYFSRKGYHSINAMIACDHNMRIMAIDPRFGGSFHDSSVWNLSNYRVHLQQQRNTSNGNWWLLGDSGYPLEMWLMTPFRAAEEGSREAAFNNKHAKARNVVERCIGLLKQRFRCLLSTRALHYSPQTAAQIINVCAALHNICLHYKIQLDLPEMVSFDDTRSDHQFNADITIAEDDRGRQLRANILRTIIP